MTWGYCGICGVALAAGNCKNGDCNSLQGVLIPPNISKGSDSIFQFGMRFTVEKGTFDIMNERAIEEKMRLVIANQPGATNYEYLRKLAKNKGFSNLGRIVLGISTRTFLIYDSLPTTY